MDLNSILTTVRVRLWLFVACVVITTAVAVVGSLVLPPTYEASTQLTAGPALGGVNLNDINQLQAAQTIASTYAAAATTEGLAQQVIDKLGLATTPGHLLKQISVSVDTQAPVITIKVDSPDPNCSTAIANAVAQQLLARSTAIQGQSAAIVQAIETQVTTVREQLATDNAAIVALQNKAQPLAVADQTALQLLQQAVVAYQGDLTQLLTAQAATSTSAVTVLDEAHVPTDPSSPNLLLNVVLALVLGTALGLGLTVAAASLDDTFKSSDELQEALGVPVLGTLGRLPESAQRSGIYGLVMLLFPRSGAAEAFRAMRTNVEFSDVDAGLHSVLVTSPASGDGKSTVAANLALAFAQAGRRTILVDSDLRRPSLHTMFDLTNSYGLTSLVRSEVIELAQVLRTVDEPNLRVLTSGPLPPNPAELLGSNRMRAIVEILEAQADLVIFDSPPTVAVTDAAVLASLVDGVVVVVAKGATRRSLARRGDEALNRVGGRILGAVLNQMRGGDRDAAYDTYGQEQIAPEGGTAGVAKSAR